ncbi:MAG: ATP-binding cassette domain-containing protein [Firmicutes bacterium]|nr:ATP-binding cassette domain-containing protein [Bacillota bacterium]
MAERKRLADTRTVLQIEATECGAACLSMILQYFGQYVSLEQLRAETDVSRDGSSARNIVRAAARRGLQCDGYEVDVEGLSELPVPCILWWQRNHFVVYEGMKGGFCYINDPAYGKRRIDMQTLERSFSDIALTFSPGEDFKNHPEYGVKPNTFFSSGRIGPLLHSHGALAASSVLFGLLCVAGGLLAAALPGIFPPGTPQGLRLCFLAGCLLCCLMGYFLCEYQLRRLEERSQLQFSWRFLRRLFRMPISFFEQRSPSDLVERVRRNDRISRFTAHTLLQGGIDAGCVAACLIFSGWYFTPAASLLILCGLLLAFGLQQMLERTIVFDETRASISEARLAGTVLSGIGKLETILNLDLGRKFAAEAKDQQQEAAEIAARIKRIRIAEAAGRYVIYGCCLAAVIPMGRPDASAGVIYTWLILFLMMIPSAESIVRTGMQSRRISEELASVDDIMPMREEMLRPGGEEAPAANPYRKLQGNIRCLKMGFSYGAFGEAIVQDLNLYLPVGSSLAVTGPSGSGKSTIGKLFGGLLEPSEGTIYYDGKAAGEIPDQVIFASIAMVRQKSELFAGTIRSNITMWNPNISEEEIRRAVEDAALSDCIAERPEGLETVLGERGSGLSGGERQRLEIARALATDPSILILDEAFSAIDDDTTERILSNIRRRGCTLIIITHDPLLIEECSRHLDLDTGGGGV